MDEEGEKKIATTHAVSTEPKNSFIIRPKRSENSALCSTMVSVSDGY